MSCDIGRKFELSWGIWVVQMEEPEEMLLLGYARDARVVNVILGDRGIRR
jgi:hypothetical protein